MGIKLSVNGCGCVYSCLWVCDNVCVCIHLLPGSQRQVSPVAPPPREQGVVSCAFLTTTMSKREVSRKWLQVVLWPSGIWMCLSWTLRSRKTRNNTRRLKRTWVKATAITSEGNKLSVEEQGSRCYLTELIREHLQKREAGTLQPLLETSGPPTWVGCDSHREKWCELSLMGLPAITSPLPWH